MTAPNTGATPPGPMTLEAGLAAYKAKRAETGDSNPDQALAATLDEDGLELPAETTEATTEETPAEETEAEAVSETESEADPELATETQQILLPDGSKITVEEARKGHLRQADYTRKTQELARAREEASAQHSQAISRVKGMLEDFEAVLGTEPTTAQMMQLRQQDPQKHAEVQAYWNDVNRVRTEARKAVVEQEQRVLQSNKAKAWQALSEGAYDPAWKDQKVLSKALDTIQEHMIDLGMTPEFINRVDSPELIQVFENDRRYRELQKAKPKAALAVKGKPKPFTPGAKSTASPQTENLRLLNEAFRKNPSIDNAARLEKARSAARR